MNNTFAEWLADTRRRYQTIEENFFGKEATPLDVTNIPFEECFSVIPLVDNFDTWQKSEFCVLPSFWPTPIMGDVEFTYTIDLDRELFSVFHAWHFPLSGIPNVWINKLGIPYPDKSPVAYPKPAVDENHVKLYEEANCAIFEVPDTQPGSNAHEGLCFETLTLFLGTNDHGMNPFLHHVFTWGPEDPPFKQLAFTSLCLADRSSFSLLQYSSRHQKRFASTGYQDIDYPATSSFWFAGVFVYLTTHLEDDQVCKAAIGHVLELTKGSGCPRSNFTAFLFSIRDLVIIDVSEEGVKHTSTLPFTSSNYEADDQTIPTPGVFAMIAQFTRSRKLLASLHRAQDVTKCGFILPYDVLVDIVEYVDWETAIVLSATSKVLRDCVERASPKCGPLHLLEYVGPNTFIGRVIDGRLAEIKFQEQDDESNSPSSFLTVIRYPGVQQRDFIPTIELIPSIYTSDEESMSTS